MIIGIEYWKEDKRLVGKEMSFDELKKALNDIFENHNEDNFVTSFLTRFGYKELPYSEGYADYIIDLDTRLVLATPQTFPKELDGAKVLYYTAKSDFEPVYYTGSEIAHKVFYLAVCQYSGEKSFYIFHLDENQDVVADCCFDNIADCRRYMNEFDVKWYERK